MDKVHGKVKVIGPDPPGLFRKYIWGRNSKAQNQDFFGDLYGSPRYHSQPVGYRYGYNAFHPQRNSFPRRNPPGTFGARAGQGSYWASTGQSHQDVSGAALKPKVITVIRNSKRPRDNVKILLNRRSVQSYEQLVKDISEAFGPKWKNSKVRRLFSMRGREVQSVSDFFRDDDVFLGVSSSEVLTYDDVQDILQEVYPNNPYAQNLIKEWDKNKKRQKALILKKEPREDGKRDSGLGSDSSHKDDEATEVLYQGKNHPKTTEDESLRLERERQRAAEAEREKARRRMLKRREAERQALEEEKRKKGMMPLKPLNDSKIHNEEEKTKQNKEEPGVVVVVKDGQKNKGKKKHKNLDGYESDNEGLPNYSPESKPPPQSSPSPNKDVEEENASPADDTTKPDDVTDEANMPDDVTDEANTPDDINGEANKPDDVVAETNPDGVTTNRETHNESNDVTDETKPDDVTKVDDVGEADHNGDDLQEVSTDKVNDVNSVEETAKPVENKLEFKDVDDNNKEKQKTDNEVRPKTPSSKGRALPITEKPHKKTEEANKKSKNKTIIRKTKLERQISDIRHVLNKYDTGKTLGDGNFAVVKQCKLKNTKNEYAMKVIDKAKLRGKENMIENEIEIMKLCNHPNIVKLIEEFETKEEIYLIMELVKGGDLFDAITQSVKFGERESASMTYDLVQALFYLHSRNIVHRDLKPENLLVCRNKDGTITLKLADFGLAMEVTDNIYTVCGTPTYVAPEILSEIGYGLEVDMWACGVIAYILLCGFPPFRSPDRNQTELFEFIKAGAYEFLSPYWDNISRSAKDLIGRLLVVDRKKRYTAIDTMCHPWVVTQAGANKPPGGVDEYRKSHRKELESQAKSNREEFLAARSH